MSSSYLHRRRIVSIAAAILFVSIAGLGVARGSDEPESDQTGRILIAGGSDVLWAVRSGRGEDGDKSDLLIRSPGGKWRKLSRFTGNPSAIGAGDRRLHVVSGGSDPSTTVFSLSSGKEMTLRMAPGGKWPVPDPPLTVSSIPALGKSNRPGFIAAVAYKSDTPSTTTATSRPAVETKSSGLIILQTVEGQWARLCDLKDIPGAVGATVSITSADNWAYILIVAKEHPARMLAWNTSDDKGQWNDVELPPQPHHPLSLQTLKKRAVLVTISQKPWGPSAASTDPSDGLMRLAIHELEAGKIAAKPQPITYQGSPLVITDQSPPITCSLGQADERQLVLLWRQDEAYRCAMVDINGQVAENKEVAALTKAVSEFDAWAIVGYFLWAIPPLMLLLILVSQKDRPLVTMPLPATFIPSAFPKRLAAIAMDFLPIVFMASIVLTIANPDLIMTLDDTQEMVSEMFSEQQPQSIPTELVLSIIGIFVVWVMYGSIMEFKFGATLGKRAMKLEVVSLDGKRPSICQVLLRNLIRPIEMIAPILVITVSLTFLTRTHQRLGDLIARTVVVEKTRNPEIIEIDPQDPPTDA